MNVELNNVRIAILQKYPTQIDFADAIQMNNTMVSHVLRGRRLLSKEQAQKWIDDLQCDPKILVPVTK